MSRSITQPLTETVSAKERARQQYRYDAISTASGVLLALFMWGHMAFVASILLGAVAFDTVGGLFEDLYLAQVGIVAILVLFFTHFVMASRKIPAKLQDRALIKQLGDGIKNSEWNIPADQASVLDKIRPHGETSMWIVQVRTGMVILALGSMHLFVVGADLVERTMGHEGITAAETATRVGGGMWILYAVLLYAVEVHAGLGLYRVAVKWWLGLAPLGIKITRHRAHLVERLVLVFFLLTGFLVLPVLAGFLTPPFAFLLGS